MKHHHIHICVFDRHCIRMWRHYGAPLRIHVSWGRNYGIGVMDYRYEPFRHNHHITVVSGRRISERVWANAKAVKIERSPDWKDNWIRNQYKRWVP